MNTGQTNQLPKFKVNYSLETGEVLGYYPLDIHYNEIPEPFIEIIEEEYKEKYGKRLKVIDGILTEIQPSNEEILTRAKSIKINEATFKRDELQYSNISYSNSVFSANQTVQFQIVAALQNKAQDSNIVWFDANRMRYNWHPQDLQGLKNAIEVRANALYQRYYEIVESIEEAVTLDDVVDEQGTVISQGVNSIQIQF